MTPSHPTQMDQQSGHSSEHTVAAAWRANGEPDPHAGKYDGERAALCMGNLTDDELANGVFLYGDGTHGRPSIEDLLAGRAHSPIAWLTAAKERIRWLSRALVRAESDAAIRGDLLAALQRAAIAKALEHS